MKRFVEREDRKRAVLLPEYLEDYVSADNPVRVVDVFVDELDLHHLGFDGTAPNATSALFSNRGDLRHPDNTSPDKL